MNALASHLGLVEFLLKPGFIEARWHYGLEAIDYEFHIYTPQRHD